VAWIADQGIGDIMAKALKNHLLVETDGKRRYISVPVAQAKDLHDYLRIHKVRSAPPEPAFTGFDNIELAPDNDVATVQALLNRF
jgi:hypothetical protein